MNAQPPVTDDDLHAYVDGVLALSRRPFVQAHLESHPEDAERVARYAKLREELREALAPIADEPIPAQLDLKRLVRQRMAARRRPTWRLACAAALVFAVGGASGYALHAFTQPASAGVRALAREAADSYRVHAVDPARPVEIAASDRAELVGWLAQRLQSPLAVPDLELAGYRFLGGRLVTTPHGPAALFLYGGARGDKLAVLVRPMAIEKNTRMSEHVDGALGTVAWADRGLGYSLVGAASPAVLHPLADEVRRQAGGG